jgi:hypothetical protein
VWEKIGAFILLLFLLTVGFLYAFKKNAIELEKSNRVNITSKQTEVLLIRTEPDFDIYLVVFRGDTSIIGIAKK